MNLNFKDTWVFKSPNEVSNEDKIGLWEREKKQALPGRMIQHEGEQY